ncbi:hypothetical protein CEP54_012459 [Fusarium duplospermum]|uniref:Uncharacterized protein n=1 Tax=Fusarium duplospermum TaxID=1325734 RepID=A0A428P8R3_9HYPO|nr:hypothetical protein CEP54_012459 [Fusarium duplospermum]
MSAAADSVFDLYPQPREPETKSRRKRLKEFVTTKHPKSSGKETQNGKQEMTTVLYHGGRQRKPVAQLLPPPPVAKQPEPEVVEQACGPHAGSTDPKQENHQEEEHEHESKGGNSPVPNDSNQTVTVRQVDQDAVKETMLEQDELIERLRKDLHHVENQLLTAQKEHDKEVAELKKTLATLRNKVTENATRSIEMPLQLPLHCPEGEIMRAWQNLTYDVGNLVSNHFRESKGSKAVTWAERKTEYLINLTPHYKDVMKEKKTATAFIEAAIWNALCLGVFGPSRHNAPFCWAGKYKGSLKTMSNFLLADIDKLKPDRLRHKAMFHQWKALTANLVVTIVPQERHDDEKSEIAEDLETILEGLSSPRTSQDRLGELRAIVDKAVDLTTKLCGQKRWYSINWFPERCHGVDLNEETMDLMAESPRSKRVRFMVRPGLCGSQGEDYDNMCVLDRCRVWAF